MIQRVATIVLLVEDLHQESLLRRYLQRVGHDRRNIRVNRSQKGTGSGEQHVREQYASEIRAQRFRVTRIQSCLIAFIDADTVQTQDRHQQFERALRDADEPRLASNEHVAVLVAKRNVETWILCLNGESVDEDTNYRHDDRVNANSIKSVAGQLYEWTRVNAAIPAECVTSLRESIPELLRIPG